MRAALAVIAALAALIAPSSAAWAGRASPTGAGLELLTSATASGESFAVRLDVQIGLDSEGEGSWGLAALSLAALWDGPTRNLEPGGPLRVALGAGLTTELSLERDRVCVTLSGPLPSLDTALWLTAERLEPRELGPRALRALHARMLAHPGTTIPPPSPPLQHTLANLYGPLAGHTAHASHARARSEPIEPLASLTADALTRAPARVLIAAPPDSLRAAAPLLARDLGALPARQGPPAVERDHALDQGWIARRPTRVTAKQDHDTRRLLVVAWDLCERVGGALRAEAAQRLLVTLLGDPGGVLTEPLVGAYGVARHVEVLSASRPATLAVIAAVRGRAMAEARGRLIETLEGLSDGTLSPPLFDGAVARAVHDLRAAWRVPVERLALISEWWSAGLLDRPPREHLDALIAELEALSREDLARWVGEALHPTRRVIVELSPSQVPQRERVVLDADTLYDYLRILVDLRCPPPDHGLELVELLEVKYGLTPEEYLALTRVVADDPGRIRQLNHEAEQRCLEYDKLRGMMPPQRVVALHRAVACGAGAIAEDAPREAALDAIFRRFDIDASVYRPLVRLGREDPPTATLIEGVDAECRPAYGPAARP